MGCCPQGRIASDMTEATQQQQQQQPPPNLGFPGISVVKDLPANAGDIISIPGSGRPVEKEMAIRSSILAWEIPWTKEPGRLQAIGLQSQI